MSKETKPPLVALHGFLGCAADWDPLFEDLGRDRTCIAIDLPGHADQPVAAPGEGLRVIAESLTQATEGLGVVDYLGYSMGGRMLYQLITDPRIEPWRRMVLVGAHPGIEDPEERKTRRLKDGWLAQQLDEQDFGAFLDTWYAQPLFGDIQRAPGYAAMRERRRANDPHAMAATLHELGTGALGSAWRELPRVRKPVLLLAGERDVKYAELNERAAARLSHGRSETVPEAAHAPHVERAGAFAAALRRFLD